MVVLSVWISAWLRERSPLVEGLAEAGDEHRLVSCVVRKSRIRREECTGVLS